MYNGWIMARCAASKVLALVSTITVTLLACGRPEVPPLASPLPPAPVWVGTNLEPMVVDWDPDQRQSLEIAMKQGVAVVEYSQRGFRLLRDCKVDGAYGYMGTTRRERVLRLDSADDVRANLPLGGGLLAVQLGGELQQGSTLDVAMVLVGQMRTTWRTVTPNDLLGRCDGASHIVRGATLGAFAMDRGDKTRARAAAEIFKLGASYGTASSRTVRNVDGSFEDCANAKPDGASPPPQCGALVRLELEALSVPASAPDGGVSSAPEGGAFVAPTFATKDPCPAGFVASQGKCTRQGGAAITECEYGEGAACQRACEAGKSLSCARYGLMMLRGDGVVRDQGAGLQLLARACGGDVGGACTMLGDIVAEGALGVTKNALEGNKAYARACDLGDPEGCQRLGARLLTGMGGLPKNPQLAAQAMERGCNGGDKNACSDLGVLFLGGSPPFATDLPRAARLFKLACDGRSGVGCANLGYMLEFGQGVRADLGAAASFYAKGCGVDATQCLWFAAMVDAGKVPGQARDEQKAVSLWKMACQAGSLPSCAILRAFVDRSVSLDMELAQAYVNLWSGTCDNKLARDCTGLGVVLLGAGRAAEGDRALSLGCVLGDAWACALRRRPRI